MIIVISKDNLVESFIENSCKKTIWSGYFRLDNEQIYLSN